MAHAKARLRIVRGDITRQDSDAIVNAANERLTPGGGVSGAIHRAGGPEIARECAAIGRCPTGSAVATTGGKLKARWVIHAVGPIWRGGGHGEAELLASAYRSALREAARAGAGSVAFPAISCGIYGYPLEEAARVAVATLREELAEQQKIREVRLVMFDEATHAAFAAALEAQAP